MGSMSYFYRVKAIDMENLIYKIMNKTECIIYRFRLLRDRLLFFSFSVYLTSFD